jgi:very-short-patch-repair endonuclease
MWSVHAKHGFAMTLQHARPGEGMNRFKSRSRSLRIAQTAAEEILWRELRNRQLGRWKFRRQHPIAHYIVDFVTLDGKLVVGVDGGTHSTTPERTRDDRRTRELEQLGFHVVRVTNADVYGNLDGVLETILHELGTI